ncbi:hypothetical protein PT285_10195 [Lactobacillus sp. ESL0791]|uniref:hypothetical protein n=1 Tax=Lactobacillus sp. ESL0791 TaxID=2983234 RepID=UPI0023FA00DA|nr:hypothetical protein [Lactobacillus sp. ESL0791]MDF7639769.1 hypothetical protein [Lactobacillus sp. ESL0791]
MMNSLEAKTQAAILNNVENADDKMTDFIDGRENKFEMSKKQTVEKEQVIKPRRTGCQV